MKDIDPFMLKAINDCEILKKVDPNHELVLIMDLEFPEAKFNNLLWDKEDPWENIDKDEVSKIVYINYYFKIRKILREEHSIYI